MKKALFSALLLLAVSAGRAQEVEEAKSGPVAIFETRLPGPAALFDTDYYEMGLDLTLGYDFKKGISLYLPLSYTVGMLRNEAKNYGLLAHIGLGCGYSPLNRGKFRLEILARTGWGYDGDWKSTYYDGGARIFYKNRWFYGLGVRYHHSTTKEFDHQLTGYVSIGGRIGGGRYKHK